MSNEISCKRTKLLIEALTDELLTFAAALKETEFDYQKEAKQFSTSSWLGQLSSRRKEPEALFWQSSSFYE